MSSDIIVLSKLISQIILVNEDEADDITSTNALFAGGNTSANPAYPSASTFRSKVGSVNLPVEENNKYNNKKKNKCRKNTNIYLLLFNEVLLSIIIFKVSNVI